ncbi:MAG TPA: hypothetical protein VGQ62_02515 [Chloroflexota bacterium]|nr:hypothetical protein [Chloroflexota bacterium]
MPPPTVAPPVLLSLDYATQQPGLPELPQSVVAYTEGALRIGTDVPDGNHGIAADQTVYRDVIIQAELSLAEGDDDDLYGLFVRSPSPDFYYTFAVSPSGHVVVSRYDGEHDPLVAGPLAAEMPFARGLRQTNLFQVVAIGPSLTFLLNGMVIVSEVVEADYQEGYLGFYVHHGQQSARAEMAAHWIQVRGVFPESAESPAA